MAQKYSCQLRVHVILRVATDSQNLGRLNTRLFEVLRCSVGLSMKFFYNLSGATKNRHMNADNGIISQAPRL